MDRASLEGCTILVVEAEPLIALDLRTALEAAGAEVHVARNGGDAVERIGQLDLAAAAVDWQPGSEDPPFNRPRRSLRLGWSAPLPRRS